MWNVQSTWFEAGFNRKLRLFLDFKEREGHVNVPRSHVEDGVALGSWLRELRDLYLKGMLDEARQLQLEEAGVVNVRSMSLKAAFNRKLRLLLDFKEREGHARAEQPREQR